MSHFKSRVNTQVKAKVNYFHKNERGFTLIEIMLASAISLLLMGVIAAVVKSQEQTFVLQNQLNQMQTNGRAATEFIARAVQNAGYNVVRGTRFLAASDHYISAVYDEDNDGIIQNNEVMTFAAGNNFTSASETYNIKPFFDQDGDGVVESSETATFPVGMTLSGPPYNMYKVIPDNSGTGVTRHLMARNIDNIVIRYYDKNNNPLPAGVAVDGDGLPIPPFDFSLVPSELNDVRKVDIEVVARTKKVNPRNNTYYSGDYVTGSVATLSGSSSYNDGYIRETFTANQAPRNLVLAPWGKMDVSANPLAVNCPTSSTTVTATLVDDVGEPVSAGTSINFVASGGATVSPAVGTTNSAGEASTTVSYDWTSPNASITVSANSLITVSGEQYPVFSASTANFQSGTGTFFDFFNGGFDPNWNELDTASDIIEWDIDTDGVDDALRMLPTGAITRTVNGCTWQQYRVEFELTPSADINSGRFVGGFLRYASANQNYRFLVYKQDTLFLDCDGNPGGLNKGFCLKIVKWNGFFPIFLKTIEVDFVPGVTYKMLAEVQGDDLRVKIWDPLALEAGNPLGLVDPNPGNWDYTDGTFLFVYRMEFEDTNTTYANGQIGLLGDWTNGANVIFDNFSVSPIN